MAELTLAQIAAGMTGDVLVLTPLYPFPEDPHACAFVHTRVKGYRERGLKVDVVTRAFDGVSSVYEFEGHRVNRLSMADLGLVLTRRRYPVVAVHFMEPSVARVLDTVDLTRTQLVVWSHGGDTLYWDRPLFDSPYFSAPRRMSADELDDLRERDALFARLNEMPQASFVFCSRFARERSAQLTGIAWNRADVIPNGVDFDIFRYQPKDPDLRRHVFTAKTHADVSCYAMDTVVRTIMELSRRPFFEDLTFTLVGGGAAHERLLQPVRRLPNVEVVEGYLTHDELAAIHRRCGVALFPTRFDTQGVSMCEAAASGLVTVSTLRESVADFLPAAEGMLVDADDFRAYADAIERLYRSPELFARCSERAHRKAVELLAPALTVEREVALLRDALTRAEAMPACRAVQGGARWGVACRGDAAGAESAAASQAAMTEGAAATTTSEAPLLTLALVGDAADESRAGNAAGRSLPARVELVSCADAREALRRARGRYVRFVTAPRDWVAPAGIEGLLDALEDGGSDVVLAEYLSLAPSGEHPRRAGAFHFMCPGVEYAWGDLREVGAYGFAGELPSLRSAVLRSDALRVEGFPLELMFRPDAAAQDAFDALEGVRFHPHVAWVLWETSVRFEDSSMKRFGRRLRGAPRGLARRLRELARRLRG
ncbi:glycosyltransferase family 4 protein [Eggerthellaceae bacterium zg-1084]|uniref:glycosyltransferase family 4 protein n=1 Tax=Berryella wangjianweii TaxID=2734634 RepID=UPI001557240C|nr:glycosyltransferase family 4 protein [Berryella wangjianweii]NPD31129.1 glycosyltransferase family 4 protein [Berryella wangjianweii]